MVISENARKNSRIFNSQFIFHPFIPLTVLFPYVLRLTFFLTSTSSPHLYLMSFSKAEKCELFQTMGQLYQVLWIQGISAFHVPLRKRTCHESSFHLSCLLLSLTNFTTLEWMVPWNSKICNFFPNILFPLVICISVFHSVYFLIFKNAIIMHVVTMTFRVSQ